MSNWLSCFRKFYKDSLTAMAFKVLFDKRHGPLVFVRIYSGKLTSGASVYNANKSCEEKVVRLMSVFADEHKNINELHEGEIGLVAGLKHTMTGDTLVQSKEDFETATAEAATGAEEDTSELSSSRAVLAAVPVHEPVFYCTVEVQSITQEKALNHALAIISREDPSVRVQHMDNGTIILSGMGELHMDIIMERIKKEFKVDAYIGPLQVAYKEAPTEEARCVEHYSRSVSGVDYNVTVNISVEPSPGTVTPTHVSQIGGSWLAGSKKEAAAQGILQVCQKGILLGYPVMDAKFKLRDSKFSGDCPPAFVTAAAYKCTHKLLEMAVCQLLEPVMNVEMRAVDSAFHDAIHQLQKHHATVYDMTATDDERVIKAQAPVAAMKGFSSSLRSATSGLADFTLEISGYQPVSEERFHMIKNELSGVS